jgi:hypothetical protein
MIGEEPPDDAPIIVPGGGVHNDHWCEYPDCKAWGSFGYAIKTETRWYCGAHREKRFER